MSRWAVLLLLSGCALFIGPVELAEKADLSSCPDLSFEQPVDCQPGDVCRTHADCAPGGFCLECACYAADCYADTDCVSGRACACAGDERYNQVLESPQDRLHVCTRQGNCQQNDDCDSGLCLGNRGDGCGGYGTRGEHEERLTGWFCATPRDACRSDDACADDEVCIYLDDRWACEPDDSICEER
ncbi:MAG: hypothetical protein AAFV53_22965 [Myxococcota bacterium]